MGNHLNGNYLLDGPTARGAHDSVKPGVESRFIGTEPQVTDQLRAMSPRKRPAAVAIAKCLVPNRCRPLRALLVSQVDNCRLNGFPSNFGIHDPWLKPRCE